MGVYIDTPWATTTLLLVWKELLQESLIHEAVAPNHLLILLHRARLAFTIHAFCLIVGAHVFWEALVNELLYAPLNFILTNKVLALIKVGEKLAFSSEILAAALEALLEAFVTFHLARSSLIRNL